MLPQRMKKVITDNPKQLADLIDLVNLPSTLREFMGQSQTSRLGCFTRVWSYIKENKLQDPNNKNLVNCDAKLKQILLVDFESLKPPAMEGLDALLAKKKHTPKSELEQNGIPQLQSSPSANWFSSSKSAKKVSLSSVTSIIDGLKKLYAQKLKPLEATYRFNDFVSPLLTNSDFDAKPMVMLLGQYSTGKTTFIKHLLKTSYPGAHIGPEKYHNYVYFSFANRFRGSSICQQEIFLMLEHFREVLSGYSIDKFEKLKPKMIQTVDDMLGYDIPELLKNFRNPYD